MEINENTLIGELVAKDYRAAEVFRAYGIDFCCSGNRSVATAATSAGLNTAELIDKLSSLPDKMDSAQPDFNAWPLDLLADYIEKKHHRYVEEKTPILKEYLEKITNVHGDRHPELHGIRERFILTAGELAMHMKKEELMLFPYIRKMVKAQNEQTELRPAPFGSIQNPVNAMMADHEAEGQRFLEMEELSDHYTPPEDGCETYRLSYVLLKEFQNDLHLHIHLENNILFPKAIELEKTLL